MNTQQIYSILLIGLVIVLNLTKIVENYSIDDANLRKFGVSFGERSGHSNKKKSELRERLKQEKKERERIESEQQMKRIKIIQHYLMPYGGQTSFLKDLHSRF